MGTPRPQLVGHFTQAADGQSPSCPPLVAGAFTLTLCANRGHAQGLLQAALVMQSSLPASEPSALTHHCGHGPSFICAEAAPASLSGAFQRSMHTCACTCLLHLNGSRADLLASLMH